jgi:D-sedoheptulose 7-phosphate isomerase
MIDKIKELITASIDTKRELLSDEMLLQTIGDVAGEVVKTFVNKGKVLLCGNGGSAADAQHIAAELSGRFYFDRDPLDAEALHVNTSYLTAVANDYSFNEVYSRAVKAKGKTGDLLIAISTSGNSPNVIKALEQAKEQKMTTVAMTGKTGGKMKNNCDYLINVPSGDTPRIQEMHILIGHIICQLTEEKLFPAH